MRRSGVRVTYLPVQVDLVLPLELGRAADLVARRRRDEIVGVVQLVRLREQRGFKNRLVRRRTFHARAGFRFGAIRFGVL